MFKITLSPQFSNDELMLVKSGDALSIDGKYYDFSSLNDGDEIPEEAISDDNIIGNITKEGSVVKITIRMPYSDDDAPESVRFPMPIMMVEDGAIAFNEKEADND